MDTLKTPTSKDSIGPIISPKGGQKGGDKYRVKINGSIAVGNNTDEKHGNKLEFLTNLKDPLKNRTKENIPKVGSSKTFKDDNAVKV